MVNLVMKSKSPNNEARLKTNDKSMFLRDILYIGTIQFSVNGGALHQTKIARSTVQPRRHF